MLFKYLSSINLTIIHIAESDTLHNDIKVMFQKIPFSIDMRGLNFAMLKHRYDINLYINYSFIVLVNLLLSL